MLNHHKMFLNNQLATNRKCSISKDHSLLKTLWDSKFHNVVFESNRRWRKKVIWPKWIPSSRSRQSAPTCTEQNPKMGFFVSVQYNDTMLQRMTFEFWKQLLKNGPIRLLSFHVLDTTLGRRLKIKYCQIPTWYWNFHSSYEILKLNFYI